MDANSTSCLPKRYGLSQLLLTVNYKVKSLMMSVVVFTLVIVPIVLVGNMLDKTLSRAQDPRANGAWLSKLTETNMKCLS